MKNGRDGDFRRSAKRESNSSRRRFSKSSSHLAPTARLGRRLGPPGRPARRLENGTQKRELKKPGQPKPAKGECLESTPCGVDSRPSKKIRQRPTLPRGFPRSTIGSGGLNFRVRDGNGWDPSDIATGKTGQFIQRVGESTSTAKCSCLLPGPAPRSSRSLGASTLASTLLPPTSPVGLLRD